MIGGIMADFAMQQLPSNTLFDAISETTYCLPDAVQLLTPCTTGNGWLRVFNLGRYALSLYDKKFAYLWIKDLNQLEAFVKPYSPEWAEIETGISAGEIRAFVRELTAAMPSVIWHPGWMTARYRNSFYVCRSIYIINAFLGAIGAKGGLPLANKPSDFGKSGLKALAFSSIEGIWNYQLEPTGISIDDFKATGMVQLASSPKYRAMEELKFKTPSGKLEIISEKLEKQGLPSLLPYTSPTRPPEGQFRLTFGRCALHTQGHTVNNALLFEQMPENVLWINTKSAKSLGISDGGTALVSQNGYSETIRAKVTDFIHPDAVFVVHGFGHTLPVESRALGRGLADNKFMKGGLDLWDPAGGGIAFQEHFVIVAPANDNR